MSTTDDEPVPRLPRGRGMKLDAGMMMRIGMTLVLLVMIVMTARPCANAASNFVTGFDEGSGSATPSEAMPKPGNVDVPGKTADDYEAIGPNSTPEDIKAAIERAKVRAAERAGAAAGSASSAGPGGAGSALPAN